MQKIWDVIEQYTGEVSLELKKYIDENMKRFFSDEQRTIIKETIEDH